MNILVAMPVSPFPPNSGAAIRRWELLRYLARRHSVTAVYFGHPGDEDASSHLTELCRAMPVPHPRRLGSDDLALRPERALVSPLVRHRGHGPDASRRPTVHVRRSHRGQPVMAADASVSVVPPRLGAGTRLKILESLAWGLPVVSTRLGCAGLALTHGEHLLVRDEPDAFAEATVQLLSDAGVWRRLSAAGRAVVEERYGWESLFEKFEAELCGFVNGAPPLKTAADDEVGVPAAASYRSHNPPRKATVGQHG